MKLQINMLLALPGLCTLHHLDCYAAAIINNHGRTVFFTVARFSADNNNFFYYKIGLQNILFAPTICIKTIIKKELHLTILNKLLNL